MSYSSTNSQLKTNTYARFLSFVQAVSKFDFVSPRAVMEEYLENIYQLRTGGSDKDESII